MKYSLLFLLTLFIWGSSPAFALRCGDKLLSLGDSKEEVVELCGEPESMETHIERRGSSYFGSGSQYQQGSGSTIGQQQYVEVEVVVDEWIYDFGRRRLQQYLRFENGRLREIRSLKQGR
ncbi:MAG: DUF2845 domain-containing protein [Methylococcales bacterium]|nr:DUF2845 domain-containing protein [Methylococcaceae bacterium]